MFQTGSPLGVLLDADELLLAEDELEVVDVEVLVLVFEDVDSALEDVEEILLVLSSTLEVLGTLEVILEDCCGCAQPDKIKAKAAMIIDVIFFFIARTLYTNKQNKKRPY